MVNLTLKKIKLYEPYLPRESVRKEHHVHDYRREDVHTTFRITPHQIPTNQQRDRNHCLPKPVKVKVKANQQNTISQLACNRNFIKVSGIPF